MTATVYPRIPDSVIEAARQLAEDGETVQWTMGDFLVEIVDELAPSFAGVPREAAELTPLQGARAEIVRQIADATGLDRSTVRDRENMARFFTEAMREEFRPLTYHQLRACRAAGPRDWRKYAEWALANLPAPVAVIRAKIKDEGHEERPQWVSTWEYMVKAAIKIVEWEDKTSKPPPALVNICVDFLRKAAAVSMGSVEVPAQAPVSVSSGFFPSS